MPDFRMQQNFPIADVINAAQKKGQLDNQTTMQQSQLFNQSLEAIGTIGKSLHDQKQQVAQALALGKLTGVDPDLARTMAPSQVLEAAKLKKGYEDSDAFLGLMRKAYGMPSPPAQPSAQPPTAPGAQPAGLPSPAHQTGAILASQVSGAPMNAPAADGSGLTPPTTGAVPVPIQAPPSQPPAFPKQISPKVQQMIMRLAEANKPEGVFQYTPGQGLQKVGEKHKGDQVITSQPGTVDKKEQDAYWRDAVRGLQSIRGDTQLRDIEAQRTAATTAYNRLRDIEYSGKAPNPIDYIDILGQVYKARTGTAPTREVLQEAKQSTSIGQLGKLWTYATGQQMPATSKDIAGSLKDMVAHMGLQADQLHDGYMQAHGHEVFNPNMSEENVTKLSKIARGKSFVDATGAKPEDFDIHLQAIKYAQEHPNDPDSPAILKKAMDAKAGKGGTIGL